MEDFGTLNVNGVSSLKFTLQGSGIDVEEEADSKSYRW